MKNSLDYLKCDYTFGPVNCGIEESNEVIKARELVKHSDELARKINMDKETIELLEYALNEEPNSVLLQITKPEQSKYLFQDIYPVEHKLFIDKANQQALLENMLSYYKTELLELQNEYRQL